MVKKGESEQKLKLTMVLSLLVGLEVVTALSVLVTGGLGGSFGGTSVVTNSPAH